MRVDPVLVVASAGALGGLVVAAPLAVAVAASALAVLLLPLLSRPAAALAVAALAATAVRAWVAVPAFEGDLLSARHALGPPRRCSGVGRVETSPALRGGALSYVAWLDSIECEGRAIRGARVRLREGPPLLARGDRVEVIAQLASVELFRNAELGDPTPAASRAAVTLSGAALAVRVVDAAGGPRAVIDRARARVRARIDATFVPAAAPMARALVLGENDLSDEDGAAFRASGLAHLLAVSGTHLVFAVLGVVRALVFLLARVEALAARRDVGRIAAAVGAVIAPLYADFAGGSGSAWRAAWMLTIGLGARALGRRASAERSFALSLGLGVALDPLVGFDVSFVLSAAATAGLLAVGAPLARRLAPPSAGLIRRSLVSSLVATVSAMLPCTPILATLGPTLTVAGIAANVAAVPFGEVVSLPLCLAHAVLPFAPLERGIGAVASGALLVVRWLARASAAVTWLAVPVPPPGPWHFVVLGVGAVGAVLVGARRFFEGPAPPAAGPGGPAPVSARPVRPRGVGEWRVWAVGTALAVLIVETAAVRAGRPRGALRVTVLDVGQGDSTLIDLPDGKLMLVDGGGFVGSPVDPGASVILPLLRVRRRSRVDVAVLTHPHPDHFLGLGTALAGVEVGELWDTGQGREQGAGLEYAAMMSRLVSRGVPIRGPGALCGPERRLGGAVLHVLAPCPSFDPALGANDNSFVIRIGLGERHVLLTGDAEHEAEARLLAAHGSELHADLLKVGHHGSRTSTSAALVRAVAPRFATVSCGVRNRFGHPSADALRTLALAGVLALRTDLVGSVQFVTEGTAVRARTFGATFEDRTGPRLW